MDFREKALISFFFSKRWLLFLNAFLRKVSKAQQHSQQSCTLQQPDPRTSPTDQEPAPTDQEPAPPISIKKPDHYQRQQRISIQQTHPGSSGGPCPRLPSYQKLLFEFTLSLWGVNEPTIPLSPLQQVEAPPHERVVSHAAVPRMPIISKIATN